MPQTIPTSAHGVQAVTQTAECPECAATIQSQATLAGEILDCPDCGVELEVRTLEPFTVEVAPQVEEDWGE